MCWSRKWNVSQLSIKLLRPLWVSAVTRPVMLSWQHLYGTQVKRSKIRIVLQYQCVMNKQLVMPLTPPPPPPTNSLSLSLFLLTVSLSLSIEIEIGHITGRSVETRRLFFCEANGTHVETVAVLMPRASLVPPPPTQPFVESEKKLRLVNRWQKLKEKSQNTQTWNPEFEFTAANASEISAEVFFPLSFCL